MSVDEAFTQPASERAYEKAEQRVVLVTHVLSTVTDSTTTFLGDTFCNFCIILFGERANECLER